MLLSARNFDMSQQVQIILHVTFPVIIRLSWLTPFFSQCVRGQGCQGRHWVCLEFPGGNHAATVCAA
jgi:hypothetical protein